MNNIDNTLNRIIMEQLGDEHADDILCKYIEKEMRIKLRKSRNKGRHGWHTRTCNNDYLMNMLKEHIKKGNIDNMVDIINIAGMIHARSKLYGEEA